MRRDSETEVQGPVVDFGERLKAATQRRLAGNREAATSSRPAGAESFGTKDSRCHRPDFGAGDDEESPPNEAR